MSWTEDRVDLLKSMWNEGKSASQIAKELGGVTRNAVIGKVHRLGLSNRSGGPERPDEAVAAVEPPGPPPAPVQAEDPIEPARPVEAVAPAPRPAPKEPPVINRTRTPGQPQPPQPAGADISPEALANLAEVAKKAKRLGLMQLTERTCKWPVGDPATEDFWFCGLPAAPGKPYCEAHVSVAFQPMSTRRDRRASSR
jgi:GcrA cell cycle regulator